MDRRRVEDRSPDSLLLADANVIEAVANSRRQHALDALRERATVDVGELAAIVRRRENLPPTATEEVRLTLYHVHLPKLAAAGLVRFEPESESVTFDPPTELEARLNALFAFTED